MTARVWWLSQNLSRYDGSRGHVVSVDTPEQVGGEVRVCVKLEDEVMGVSRL